MPNYECEITEQTTVTRVLRISARNRDAAVRESRRVNAETPCVLLTKRTNKAVVAAVAKRVT